MKALSCSLLVGIGLLLPAILFGQVRKEKFGKVSTDDVRMESYAEDPEAGAVVLYEEGSVSYRYVGQDLQQTLKIHRRVKILGEGGLEYADVSIPYLAYRGYEGVTNIKAMTHYVDESGKVQSQKISKSDILDEDVNGQYHLKKFSFPNARVGAVLEFSYQKSSKDFVSLPTWVFQEQIPVAHSQYITNVIKGFDYRNVVMGGSYPIQRSQEGGTLNLGSAGMMNTTRTSYVCQNIPALVKEPYVSSLSNYFYRVELQLQGVYMPGFSEKDYLKSWNQLAKQMMKDEDFGEHLESSKAVKEVVPGLLAEAGEDTLARIQALYEWTQKNTDWDDREGKYANVKEKVLLKEGKGNGTSINILLINLLREAGFQADPVLVSTRENGLPQSIFPTLRQFNHTIVAVDLGKESPLLLDAQSGLTPYDMLPMQDLNGMGMRVTETGATWIPVEPTHANQTIIQLLAELSADGQLTSSQTFQHKGYACLTARKEAMAADDEQTFLSETLQEGFNEVELSETALELGESRSDPLVTTCQLSTSDFVQKAGEFIYLEPMLHQATDENPFKLEKRSYPVNFGAPISERYILTLKLPEGYTVEEAPEPTRVSLPEGAGSFQYQVMAMGNQLQVMSEIKVNKIEFSPNEYGQIRQLFDMIVAKHAEQVVLTKAVESAQDDSNE
ncbi:MAG: DUF3857 domain-containing protein [Bacteroidota bacterium]